MRSRIDKQPEKWVTIQAERVLYVDRGKTAILCDRLPSPVTLVVKLSEISVAIDVNA